MARKPGQVHITSMEYIKTPARNTPPKQPNIADNAFLFGPITINSVDTMAYMQIIAAVTYTQTTPKQYH